MAPETLRQLESHRVEVVSELTRLANLYLLLTNFSRADLRRALPTASPDSLLTALLTQLATTEQKLAELKSAHASSHPDVQAAEVLLRKIHEQVDERIDGILAGFKLKLSVENARLEAIERELKATKKKEIDQAVERRGYYQAKRDLESLRYISERLRLRIWQEKLDAQLPQ
jgi:uncharacterized protein involved in exopolysaccharide biosynthesis